MSLDIADAKGALTGERYIQSLRDGREVWLNGERVADVTTHPAFMGAIREFARIYDLQHSPEYGGQMTFPSPDTGRRVSLSWIAPMNVDELRRKWRNTEVWMEQSWGQLGRTPDFMAGVILDFYTLRDQLAAIRPMFGENVTNYFRYAREHDLSLTHALGDPQIDRKDVFLGPVKDPDLALRVIEETPAGVIMRGAKQLATLAPISNEIGVYLSRTFRQRAKDEFVQWFAIPLATPGLKILCREPLSLPSAGHSYPFGSRFDEQDAMVFFDDVLVPWERIFLLYDRQAAFRLSASGTGFAFSTQIRFYQRLLTYVGVTTMVAEAIGVDGFPEVRERMGELIMYAEVIRLLIKTIQNQAEENLAGRRTGRINGNLFSYSQHIAPRMVQILREIGASGLLMQPSEADLANPDLRPFIDKYMYGATMDAEHKSRLFRIGWDLTLSGFGARQDLYELWHMGDVTRNRTNLFLSWDRSRITEKVRKLMADPDAI